MYCYNCRTYLKHNDVEVHKSLAHQVDEMRPEEDELYFDPPNVSQLRDLEI